MNGELTIKDLFRKYGRRFVTIFKNADGINTVGFYEIITVKGEPPIIKLKVVEFDENNQELFISSDDEGENWFEAYELKTLVENGFFFPLSSPPTKASRRYLKLLDKYRKLALKVFEYEKLLDDLELFSQKYEQLRVEIINSLNDVINTVFE
ncbi:MAG: hypothetical protein HXL38_000890 [Candidatus Saccharimonas sp.]|nr:MAG: hypothetical protein HXL38_000890 [Candidatus Saccharimonas sp.]